MKKLLLAPFLLASLFSFGGELKADPLDLNLKPPAPATDEVWQMVRVYLDQERFPMGWGDDDCIPKNKDPKNRDVCKKNHRHLTNPTKFALREYEGISAHNPMFFTNLSSCRSSAMDLKSFYKSNPLTKRIAHNHRILGGNGWGYSAWHNHQIYNGQKIDLKYICIKSSAEENRNSNSSSLSDRWYLELIDTYRDRFVGWNHKNCQPKDANGNCERDHSHPINENYELLRGKGRNSFYFSSFSSLRQCNEAANELRNFVRNLNLDGVAYHNHSGFEHNHLIEQKFQPILKHICLKAKGN